MSWLTERTRAQADAAFVWRDRVTTYGELAALEAAHRARLEALGVGPGTVVAFVAPHSPSACALLLALVELRAVVVPLARAQPCAELLIENVDGDWKTTRLASTAAHPLMKELGGAGLVIFTSGSTGTAKAALHDVARLLARYEKPRPPSRVLAFLLLDHLGGIHTLLHTLANGGTVVAAEDRSVDAICAAIARHRVQLLPASPTFLNLLLMADAPRRFDLSSLELVTYGTEVMPATTLARLHAALPSARLVQTYGLTELGVFASRSRARDSLWVQVGGDGVETKIVDGELWIRSRMAMLGYLNAPSPFDEDGWFNTHDRVLADGDFIRILGRASEIINVGGEKVYPAEVESVLAEMPNVRDATVFAHKSPMTGSVVAARVVLAEPEDPAALRRRVREFCASRLARHKIPVRVELADESALGERGKKLRPS